MLAQDLLHPRVDCQHGRVVHRVGRGREAPRRMRARCVVRKVGKQSFEERIGLGTVVVAEVTCGIEQATANALGQLAGRRDRERHHEDARRVEWHAEAGPVVAVTEHEPDVQRRDRPRLAGAGARLDQTAAPQRERDRIELLAHAASRSLATSACASIRAVLDHATKGPNNRSAHDAKPASTSASKSSNARRSAKSSRSPRVSP